MVLAWRCPCPCRGRGRCRRGRGWSWRVSSAAVGRASKSGRARGFGWVGGWCFGVVVDPGRYLRRRPPAPSARGRGRGVFPRMLTSLGLLLSSTAASLVGLAVAGAAVRARGLLLLPRSSTPEFCATRTVSERNKTKRSTESITRKHAGCRIYKQLSEMAQHYQGRGGRRQSRPLYI